MRRFPKPTLKDVARKAGVSVTAVSLVVSGRQDICSAATAERIRAAVAELNYTPNSLAGGVQGRLRSTVGICMAHPLSGDDVLYGIPFFARLWRGILAEADASGYCTLSYPANVRTSQGSTDLLLDGRVDGILFHTMSYDNARTARIAAAGMPLVLLNRSLELPEGCATVFSDDAEVTDLALTHLWGLGHRRIAHLAGPVEGGPGAHPDREWADDAALRRLNAYHSWMEVRGVAAPELVGHARAWIATHVSAILDHWMALPEPPTAVYCANDILVLAVIAEAGKRGLQVPRDLSVVGVDNSDAARDGPIPLTTIEVPIERMGREGMQTLLRLLQGAPLEACRTAVSGATIVVQSSTAHYAPHG